jgi:hypothetical protein
LRKTLVRVAFAAAKGAHSVRRALAPTESVLVREFAIRINKLGHKIWSGAMLSV